MKPETLVAATGCRLADAWLIAKPMADVMAQYAITTPLRKAAFVAQMAHESVRFRRLEENLNYTSAGRIQAVWPSKFPSVESAIPYVRNPGALANYVYANRNGNGSEASGDGWRYRGRGLPQLTGLDNYFAFGSDIGEPIVSHPDLVAHPPYACLAAGWLWKRIGANLLADAEDINCITQRIVGRSMRGKADRFDLFRRALGVFKQED